MSHNTTQASYEVVHVYNYVSVIVCRCILSAYLLLVCKVFPSLQYPLTVDLSGLPLAKAITLV